MLLLLVGLFEPVDNLLPSQASDACCDQVDQSKRSDIARRIRKTVDRYDDELICKAGQGRQHRVCDTDAVSSILLRSLDTFDCHAKSPAEAYADDDVLLGGRASQMCCASRSNCRKNG